MSDAPRECWVVFTPIGMHGGAGATMADALQDAGLHDMPKGWTCERMVPAAELEAARIEGMNQERSTNWMKEARTITELRAEVERLSRVLIEISEYGSREKWPSVPFPHGICPYGCDTPSIASAALAAKEAP